jgi:WD40 repeat protein
VWDPLTGKLLLGPLKGTDEDLFKFVSFVNNDDELIAASTSESRLLHRWSVKTGEQICDPVHMPINPEDDDPEENRHFALYSFALTRDESLLVTGSGSFEKRVVQWDVLTGKATRPPYFEHKNVISAIAVSPDGKHVATASWDETIHIWDLSTGKRICNPLRGHSSWVHAVSYSPSGNYIVSGSGDRSIIVWDAQTGAIQCGPLYAQDDVVYAVRFTLDEKQIVSSASSSSAVAGDGTVVIWNVQGLI